MTTRTLLRNDIASIVQISADSLGEIVGTPATPTPSESMAAPQASMAAVVDGVTLVIGISIDDASLRALTQALKPDLDSEPGQAEIVSTRLTVITEFFTAIETGVGQSLVDVDPEPFDSMFSVGFGESTIEIGVASILGAAATAPSAGNRLPSVRLDVSVELGRAKIPVKELLALDEGGVIRL